MIQKKKIKNAFSRNARLYDTTSTLQQEIAEVLLSHIQASQNSPKRILDVGTGTGRPALDIALNFKEAKVIGYDFAPQMLEVAQQKKEAYGLNNIYFVQGDAEELAFASNSFDAVISNAAYQWLDQPCRAFGELHRILKKQGQLYASIFGGETLKELEAAFEEAHKRLGIKYFAHTQRFLSEQDLKAAFGAAGFKAIRITSVISLQEYDSVAALLKVLKTFGAGNVDLNGRQGLGGRQLLEEMMRCYETHFRVNGRIPATFEIFLINATKP